MKIETQENGITKIEFREERESKIKFNEIECTSKTGKKINPLDCGFVPDAEELSEAYKEQKIKQENTKENLMNIIREVFESKIKDLRNPNRFNTGQIKITMQTIDRPDIDQIADIDKDISGYDRIRVFDSMERRADITVVNDGPSELYFIVNRNGIDHEEESWSQNEIMIYPGEAWKMFDVHELRIRSETQGNKYRITEDEVVMGSTIRSVS